MNQQFTGPPRQVSMYLAATNSKGKAGYATCIAIKSNHRKPYTKWFAQGLTDTTRKDATYKGLFQALDHLQSRCTITIYCNDRFVQNADEIKRVISNVCARKSNQYERDTTRFDINIVEPDPESPQGKHLAKVADLSKWARSTGSNIL